DYSCCLGMQACVLFFSITLIPLTYLFFFFNAASTTEIYTLSLHDALPIFLSNRYKLITNVRSSLMAVNIHITIIELNALHTKRQNLFQELDAVIHLLMEAKHWEVRFESSSVPTTLPTAYDVYPLDGRHDGGYYTVKDCVTIDVLPRTPGNNVYVGFMVWSNFTATKCRGLVSLNQVIKEIICLQPLK